MAKIALSLGSNMDNRRYYLDQGIDQLIVRCGLTRVQVSSFYETDPVGFTEQPPFMNCALVGKTDMAPEEILEIIHEIEQEQHRVRTLRWGPRTLDIDILLYDDLAQDDPVLTIPHPRMKERAFVVVPLLEIWPEAMASGQKLEDCLPALQGQGIRKLEE